MIMTSTSHAPWKAKFGSGGWVVLSARGEVVAFVPQDMIHAEANSRLIAAAPEMLASLIELESMVAEMLPKHGPCGWGELALNQARAAIAKAQIED